MHAAKSSCFGGLLWGLTPTCCRAQGILWSLCIFYSASSLGSAYYERETVRRGPPTRTGDRPLELLSKGLSSVCSPPLRRVGHTRRLDGHKPHGRCVSVTPVPTRRGHRRRRPHTESPARLRFFWLLPHTGQPAKHHAQPTASGDAPSRHPSCVACLPGASARCAHRLRLKPCCAHALCSRASLSLTPPPLPRIGGSPRPSRNTGQQTVRAQRARSTPSFAAHVQGARAGQSTPLPSNARHRPSLLLLLTLWP